MGVSRGTPRALSACHDAVLVEMTGSTLLVRVTNVWCAELSESLICRKITFHVSFGPLAWVAAGVHPDSNPY